MSSISKVAKKQKEKWYGLETLLEAMARKRDLVLNPQVVPEVKDAKCGLKLNPLKTTMRLRQKQHKILNEPKTDNRSSVDLKNPNSFKNVQKENIFNKSESDDKTTLIYTTSCTLLNTTGDNTTSSNIPKHFDQTKIAANYHDSDVVDVPRGYNSNVSKSLNITKDSMGVKFPSKTISYVLPIESFNDFKILVPTNKLEMQTDDGEIVVIDPCDDNTSVNYSKKSEDTTDGNCNILKQHQKNMTVLEVLTGQKQDHNVIRWKKHNNCYIYFTDDNKKYTISCETGTITCDDLGVSDLGVSALNSQMTHSKPTGRSENIPKLERNLLIPWNCCGKFLSKSLKYGSIIECVHNKKRSSKSVLKGRLVLKRLRKKQNFAASARFILCSTKFGSFMEKFVPEVHIDHNYIRRDYKVEEEKLFSEIKDCIPVSSLLDQTRLGILKSSISYIQQLERKLKESLCIIQPPTSAVNSTSITDVVTEAFDESFIENIQQHCEEEIFIVPIGNSFPTATTEEVENEDLQHIYLETPGIRFTAPETILPTAPHTVPFTGDEISFSFSHSPLSCTTDYSELNDSLCDKLYYQLIDCAAIHCSLLETTSCVETNFLDSYKYFNGSTGPSTKINSTIHDILRVMHEYKSTGCFEPTFKSRRKQSQSRLLNGCTPKHTDPPVTLADLFPVLKYNNSVGLGKTDRDLAFSQEQYSEHRDNLFLLRDNSATEHPVEEMMLHYNDDVMLSSQDDVMFQMNYNDVNLNSLSTIEEGGIPDDTHVRRNSSYEYEYWKTFKDENWKINTKEESWKSGDGDNLFSPSLVHLHSEGEFNISSP